MPIEEPIIEAITPGQNPNSAAFIITIAIKGSAGIKLSKNVATVAIVNTSSVLSFANKNNKNTDKKEDVITSSLQPKREISILISSTVLLRTLSFPCLEGHASQLFHPEQTT